MLGRKAARSSENATRRAFRVECGHRGAGLSASCTIANAWGLSHALCCRAEAASDVHATWFHNAGVRMALGSDIRPLKDAALLEMGLWVRDRATPWQTPVAATLT